MNTYDRIYNLLLEEAFLLEQRKPMTTRQKIGTGLLAGLATFGAGGALKSSTPSTAQAQPSQVTAREKLANLPQVKRGRFKRDLSRKVEIWKKQARRNDRAEQQGSEPPQGAERLLPNIGQRADVTVRHSGRSAKRPFHPNPHYGTTTLRGAGPHLEPKLSEPHRQSGLARSGRELLQSTRDRRNTAVRNLRGLMKREKGKAENIGLTSTVTRELKGKGGETTGTMQMGRGSKPFEGGEYRSTKPRHRQ